MLRPRLPLVPRPSPRPCRPCPHPIAESTTLTWLLSETFEPENFADKSFLGEPSSPSPSSSCVVEVGPRLAFVSPFSTNAVSICAACGIPVLRLERFRRYRLFTAAGKDASPAQGDAFAALVHDRMTEWRVREPLTSFASGLAPEPVRTIPVLAEGRAVLERVNKDMGLSLDARDVDYLLALFRDDLKRDPTDVELFDFSQSNSEHSRHWFFRGRLVIDGAEIPFTLMDLVKKTLDAHPDNSVIALADNSSAIRGFPTRLLLPATPGVSGPYTLGGRTRHLLLTAETHNFPTGVAPFPGAETGTGGRIRDSHATGRGSYPVAGTAGYCVGALRIPGYPLPWEDDALPYPPNLAQPLQIAIDASNGASDYGNKFGEPVILGFARSVRIALPGTAERREYIKPIMFTAGIGHIDDDHIVKGEGEPGMVAVKLGGPAYRIGMGGSAASSMTQGDNKAELDFNAVQRGDAEMEQKVNRVIRACCELGAANPIVSIHDQGAGGNCNVLKEIISPAGGKIDVRKIIVGDASLSVLEIWGAEYQEADALLLRPDAIPLFTALCARERVPVAYVGEVTGDGNIHLVDSNDNTLPVNLPLEKVLGKMPQKTFVDERRLLAPPAGPVADSSVFLPPGTTVAAALDRLLRLLAVGSKRWLTNKVDRSVTGLIAQQQCVGPLHTPLSDCAVVASSFFDTVGIASSIGEQPVKGLANPSAMARLAVAESITNIVSARISSLVDAKCSANWMWAAKMAHEGAALFDAATAMADFMVATGVAVDGGKDSLSMAAKTPDGATVKAPGTLVISLYAPCPDVRNVRTPDLKKAGGSTLIHVRPCPAGAPAATRIGGSALLQVFKSIGSGAPDSVPDCERPDLLVALFDTTQSLLDAAGLLLSVHDCSDGGLLTAALEMAFAGNAGVTLALPAGDVFGQLFAEEVGILLEVPTGREGEALAAYAAKGVHAVVVGASAAGQAVSVTVGGASVLAASMPDLRDTWEATSFQLERRQCDPAVVEQEEKSLKSRKAPPFALSFTPTPTSDDAHASGTGRPRVAVLREEGTNGDREMCAAFFAAGFEVVDVTMSDLVDGRATIDGSFRGLVFPGGFSYADVLDSAKGWAGTIRHNKRVLDQLSAFYARPDTFSLGVCNGCQLMALLGWVPFGPTAVQPSEQPRFVHNASQRFESRFSTVRITDSPAMMFKGMAGSVLGVWVAHGEGRAHFPDAALREAVACDKLVPIVYVDDDGKATEAYPFNPNGSPSGIAGLCTADGRHLAVMPHPERVHRLWQWPYMPEEWKGTLEASPWMKMFENAYEWCMSTASA